MSILNSQTFRQRISGVKDIYISKLHKRNILDLINNALNINNENLYSNNSAPGIIDKNYISSYLKSILENELFLFITDKNTNNDLLLNVISYLNGNDFNTNNNILIRIYGDDNQFQEYKITQILDIISYHQDSMFRKRGITDTAERIVKRALNNIIHNNIIRTITAPDNFEVKVLSNIIKIKSSLYKDLIDQLNKELRSKLSTIIPNYILDQKYQQL